MRGNFHDNSDKNHIFKSMLFSNKDEEENIWNESVEGKSEYHTIENNTKSIKEKLNLLEKNIKNEINHKKINNYSNSKSYKKLNFSDKKTKLNSLLFNDKNKNALITSYNLDEIRLNNELFKNKLKSIEDKINEDKKNNLRSSENKFSRKNNKREDNSVYQDDIYDDKFSNYLNDSIYNYKEKTRGEIEDNNKRYKKTKKVNFLENDNNNNYIDYNDNDNDYLYTRYKHNTEKDNSFKHDARNSIKSNFSQFNNFNLNKKNERRNYLSKTVGYYDPIEKNISPQKDFMRSSQIKFTNNDVMLDYTKNELNDLDKKIQHARAKINKCLNKTEVSLVEGRNDISTISKSSRDLNRLRNTKSDFNKGKIF